MRGIPAEKRGQLLMQVFHGGCAEDDEKSHPKYLWILCIKLVLVLCLLTLFLYTVIFKADQDEEEEGEQYESIPFQRAALWMGFFIILCAAAMKHLHQ